MHRFQEPSFDVGKYRVSPLTLHDEAAGSFEASVSIRSGRGRESLDRVYRFLPRFATRAAAHRYAAREGALLATPPTPTQESPWPKKN